jgi:hypothetical protein
MGICILHYAHGGESMDTHEWEWNPFASIVCGVHFHARGGESMEYGHRNGSGTLLHPLFVEFIFMPVVVKVWSMDT